MLILVRWHLLLSSPSQRRGCSLMMDFSAGIQSRHPVPGERMREHSTQDPGQGRLRRDRHVTWVRPTEVFSRDFMLTSRAEKRALLLRFLSPVKRILELPAAVPMPLSYSWTSVGKSSQMWKNESNADRERSRTQWALSPAFASCNTVALWDQSDTTPRYKRKLFWLS